MIKWDGTRKNMARLRGKRWATAFILRNGFAKTGVRELPTETELHAYWYEIMRGVTLSGMSAKYNEMTRLLSDTIATTLHEIRTCEHDFTGRDDSFGIADDTVCTHCGVPVMAGNLIALPE